MKLNLMVAAVGGCAVLAFGGTSLPAFAADPPVEGTTCSGDCTLQNANWSWGATTETGSQTGLTYESETSETVNRATVASGGRANENNQSNFKTTTTTTITYDQVTTETPQINNGGGSPPPKKKTETTTTITDSSTETTTEHVKPTH